MTIRTIVLRMIISMITMMPFLENSLHLRSFNVQLRHRELVLSSRTEMEGFPWPDFNSPFDSCAGFDSQGFMTWTEYCYTKTSDLEPMSGVRKQGWLAKSTINGRYSGTCRKRCLLQLVPYTSPVQHAI